MRIGKKIIYGCEASGDAGTAYMTRYTLLSCPLFQVCIHVFHRSDGPELHDHPWPFVSLILWRGYTEEFASRFAINRDRDDSRIGSMVEWESRKGLTRHRRVWPGMLLFRSAEHAHRVELVEGKAAVTLVIMGAKKRNWGFFTKRGWQLWTQYFRERGC